MKGEQIMYQERLDVLNEELKELTKGVYDNIHLYFKHEIKPKLLDSIESIPNVEKYAELELTERIITINVGYILNESEKIGLSLKSEQSGLGVLDRIYTFTKNKSKSKITLSKKNETIIHIYNALSLVSIDMRNVDLDDNLYVQYITNLVNEITNLVSDKNKYFELLTDRSACEIALNKYKPAVTSSVNCGDLYESNGSYIILDQTTNNSIKTVRELHIDNESGDVKIGNIIELKNQLGEVYKRGARASSYLKDKKYIANFGEEYIDKIDDIHKKIEISCN